MKHKDIKTGIAYCSSMFPGVIYMGTDARIIKNDKISHQKGLILMHDPNYRAEMGDIVTADKKNRRFWDSLEQMPGVEINITTI